MKNTNAIEKIITELARRDYEATIRRLTNAQKKNIATGKKVLSDYMSIDLSSETVEAIETKRAYLCNEISEAEYKNYCLKYNLRTV